MQLFVPPTFLTHDAAELTEWTVGGVEWRNDGADNRQADR